jgi:hypothetical protein
MRAAVAVAGWDVFVERGGVGVLHLKGVVTETTQ